MFHMYLRVKSIRVREYLHVFEQRKNESYDSLYRGIIHEKKEEVIGQIDRKTGGLLEVESSTAFGTLWFLTQWCIILQFSETCFVIFVSAICNIDSITMNKIQTDRTCKILVEFSRHGDVFIRDMMR